jgi:hypothetical protein
MRHVVYGNSRIPQTRHEIVGEFLPIANTWTEESVAEWLNLGYLVEIGLPAGTAGRGGRREADVVGARVVNGKLEICHCEVAEWLINASAEELVAYYLKKFSKEVRDSVEAYFCEIFGSERVHSYKELIITKYYSKRFPEIMRRALPGSEPMALEDFISSSVVNSIKNWKERHRTPKGSLPQLRRAYWLLKMIEFLSEWHLNFRNQASRYSKSVRTQ